MTPCTRRRYHQGQIRSERSVRRRRGELFTLLLFLLFYDNTRVNECVFAFRFSTSRQTLTWVPDSFFSRWVREGDTGCRGLLGYFLWTTCTSLPKSWFWAGHAKSLLIWSNVCRNVHVNMRAWASLWCDEIGLVLVFWKAEFAGFWRLDGFFGGFLSSAFWAAGSRLWRMKLEL